MHQGLGVCLASCLVGSYQLLSGIGRPGADPAPSGPRRSCQIAEVSRTPLRLPDGREVYVEPQSIATDGRRILMGGRPSYVWARDDQGVARPGANDETIGVLLEDHEARLIDAPVGARLLDDVRVLSLGGGRWAVLTPELSADSRFPERDGATHVWYAEHDGQAWTLVEEVPRPPGGRLQTFASSELVEADGGIGWLAPVVSPDGSGRVQYFHRGPAGWTIELVSPHRADALALARDGGSGVVAALAGADEDVRGWRYALRTTRRGARWTAENLVAVAADDHVLRQPRLSRAGATVTLTWIREPRSPTGSVPGVWAAAESEEGQFGAAEPVDAGSGRAVPTPIGDTGLIWITDREDPATGRRELRLIHRTADGPLLVGVIPNPFTGYFSATWRHPEVVIVGPEFNPTPGAATVRSLIIRVTLSC